MMTHLCNKKSKRVSTNEKVKQNHKVKVYFECVIGFIYVHMVDTFAVASSKSGA
jgi:hypothetical protein